MGGGGRQSLTFAAQEADIVGIDQKALRAGGLDAGGDQGTLAKKVGWVRNAALKFTPAIPIEHIGG